MSAVIYKARDYVSNRLRTSQTTGPILLAALIGMAAGFIAIGLRLAIDWMGLLFQGYLGGWLSGALGSAWTIPVVALGGLLVGLISHYFAPETKGHGIPEVMLAVARHGGRIRARVAIVKFIAVAITLGAGGSAGRKGPIVYIGSALGSAIAQWLRLSDRMVVLAVACGAAGGIAATFNAPMAGVIFALEVIVRRFTVHYFGLVVISSASATMVMRWLADVGDYMRAPLLPDYSLAGPWDLFCFVLLGALAALIAHAFIRSLHLVEYVTEKAPMHEVLKPAVGGALVGLIAIWTPEIMGSGYETIEAALNDNLLAVTLVLLCVAKMVGTALTVGSGGSGGVFVPSLFMGAMVGGAYGAMVNAWWPGLVSSPVAYAMVGMSVLFAAAAHAPITGILVLIEMTDNYFIIVPLMSATVMGTFISQRISKDSMYTIKLTQRGIHIADAPEVNLMDAITVEDAMSPVDSVSLDMPVAALIKKMSTTHETGFPVVGKDQALLGIVTARDVEDALLTRSVDELSVRDVYTRPVAVCRPEQSLSSALSHFGAYAYGRIPVIDPHNPGRVIGVLNRQNIIAACVDAQSRSDEMLARADHLQDLNRKSAMVIVSDVISAGAPLAGVYVRDAQIPSECILGAIRRGSAAVVPRGSTPLQAGDELILVTTEDDRERVARWLHEHS